MNVILPQAMEWVKSQQMFPIDLSIIDRFLLETNLSLMKRMKKQLVKQINRLMLTPQLI
jgi:hypothetical protein